MTAAKRMGRPPMMPLTPFGERLRELVARAGYRNRSQFVGDLGITATSLWRYETGQREVPEETLEKMALLLNTSADILRGHEKAPIFEEYASLKAFLKTEMGRTVTPQELLDLSGRYFRSGSPTVETWQMLLLALRTTLDPVEEREVRKFNDDLLQQAIEEGGIVVRPTRARNHSVTSPEDRDD